MMMAPNPGFEAGLRKRSKLQRLAWAWRGAEKNAKERRLNPLQAIYEGRELSDSISNKLAKNSISRKDGAVAVVFAKRDSIGKLAGCVVFESLDPHADSKDLEAARKHIMDIPVGFLVCILDRPNKNFISHARPLRLEDPALKLLEQMVEKAAELKDW